MSIAIGDIHGCRATLERLVARLPPQGELIFLGDYIDRGPDSIGVVSFLKQLAQRRPCRFLMGNHEDMMLHAIADSAEVANWVYNGGHSTLANYGTEMNAWNRSTSREAFLGGDLEFFSSLEPYFENETHIFVHAGVDVTIPEMARQDPQILLWTREKFFRNSQLWQGKEIVFGHTPTLFLGLNGGEVFQAHKITGIDTGCVYGGRLTALDTETGRIYQEPSDFVL